MARTQTFGIIALMLMLVALLALPGHATLVVNTYTNDFSASSANNEQLKLCACETKVDTVIVENTGDFIADFHVQVSTDYPGSVTVPSADFTLAPKQFQEVPIYIGDSCGKTGTFTYDVIVTNSYGRTQTISRTIRSDVCQTTLLLIQPDTVNVGLCQPATFKVNVTNVGTFADTYHLDFGPYNTTAPVHDLYLQPGQSITQNATFQFACTDYGTRTVPFTVLTQKNGIGAQTSRDITITNDYDFGIDLPQAINVCAQATTKVPLGISNAASVPDDIALTMRAPGFVSLPPQAHLDANEDKNVSLLIDAPKGSEGQYSIGINAYDIYGHVSKDRGLTLTVSTCYAPAIEIRDTPTTALTAPVQACCGPKTFYVNVRNDGDVEQLFDLSVDGPSFFTLDDNAVRLSPHQNVNVPLRVTLPCSDERVTATVYATPQDQPQANVSATIAIDSQTQRTCHMVQIDDDELTVRDDMTVQPVIVKQTGSAGGTYDITANSTLFGFQEQNITLAPGDQRAIHMVAKANLTMQERGRYIVAPTFTLVDPALGIPYNEHVGVQLTEKGFFERLADWFLGLPWGQLGLCGWTVIAMCIVLLLLIVLLIMIYAGKVSTGDMSRWGLTTLKTILLALIVLVLITIIFLRAPSDKQVYERVASSTNATVLEWYQNGDKTIDMSQYFYDPDRGDIISYTVTQPRDIKVSVSGSLLTLTPDTNFVGENTMIITAKDNNGGVTDSPVFILHVIPYRSMGLLEWMHAWCHFIVTILAALILLLLFLVVLTIKERRQDLKRDHVLVVVDRNANDRSDQSDRSARIDRMKRAASKETARKETAKTAKGIAAKKGVKAATRKAITPLPIKRVAKRGAKQAAQRKAKPKRASAKRTSAKRNAAVKKTVKKAVAAKKATAVKTRTKTTRPAKGVTIRETKAGGKTVNIEVNAPTQPAQQGPTIVTVPGAKASEIVYIGAKGGNTVHTPYCMVARRIPRNKRIAFSTKKEAINAGLVPCRMCRPFEGGI